MLLQSSCKIEGVHRLKISKKGRERAKNGEKRWKTPKNGLPTPANRLAKKGERVYNEGSERKKQEESVKVTGDIDNRRSK